MINADMVKLLGKNSWFQSPGKQAWRLDAAEPALGDVYNAANTAPRLW
jgi:hypothetical protein